MKPRFSAVFAGLALFAATLGLASPAAASSAIVNISAANSTAATPAWFTFNAGNYRIAWAGVAGGGLYDGYNLNCPNGVCPNSGWQNGFVVLEPGDPDVVIFRLSGAGGPGTAAMFSSALAALTAYQTAPTLTKIDVPPPYNGVGATVSTIAQPWIATIDTTTTVGFFISDNGSRLDNVGGVSLRITAVPEPATWALMISGFGLAGVALRRRQRALA
jgi:PEP-CTERM motif